MTIVAVCAASGSAGATTTSVALAAMLPAGYPTLLAECDPSGGDVAGWAQLSTSPGWSTAVSRRRPILDGDRRQLPAAAVGAALLSAPDSGGAGAHRGRRGGDASSPACWRRRPTSSPSPTADGSALDRAGVGASGAADAAARPPVDRCRRRRRCHVSIGRSRRSACCAARAARSAWCSSAALHTGRRRSPAALGVELFGVLPGGRRGRGPRRRRLDAWASGRRAVRSPRRRRRSASVSSRRSTDGTIGRTQLWTVGGGGLMMLAPPRQPIDPTLGELPDRPASAARACDRRHRRQARGPQGPGVARRRLADVGRRREGRLGHRDPPRARPRSTRRACVGGQPPLSDHTHQAVLDAVMAHIYGLGELDALWGNRRCREHRRQRARQGVRHLRRRRARALDTDRRRPGGADRADPPGRPATRRQRGRVRRSPSAARSAACPTGPGCSPCSAATPATAWPPSRCCRSAGTATSPCRWTTSSSSACCRRQRASSSSPRSGPARTSSSPAITTPARRRSCAPCASTPSTPHQRVVTVEAFITELGLHQGDRLPNTVALYSRPPSAEGEGEQTVSRPDPPGDATAQPDAG